MRKKKNAKTIISPNLDTDAIKVPIRTLIDPKEVKLRSGLNNLKVLIPE
jgi:hypothetical protein